MNPDQGVVARFARPLAKWSGLSTLSPLSGIEQDAGQVSRAPVIPLFSLNGTRQRDKRACQQHPHPGSSGAARLRKPSGLNTDVQSETRISPVRSPLALPSPESAAFEPSPPEHFLHTDPTSGPTRSITQELLQPDVHVLDPLLHHLSPSSDPLPNTRSRSDRLRRWLLHAVRSNISRDTFNLVILLSKILSLQPDILRRRIYLSTPVDSRANAIASGMLVVGLTILALASMRPGRRDGWVMIIGVLLHVVVLWAATAPYSNADRRGNGSGMMSMGHARGTQVGGVDEIPVTLALGGEDSGSGDMWHEDL